MIHDCSVHRSTGFSPSPHLGPKLLYKKGLLEELGWERISDLVALVMRWVKCCGTETETLGGQAGTSCHRAHYSHQYVSFSSFGSSGTSSLWSSGLAMEKSLHYFLCYSIFDKQKIKEKEWQELGQFCPCSHALVCKSCFSFAPVNYCQYQWLEMVCSF